MKLIRTLVIASFSLVSLSAQAQRESFEATTVRIIEPKVIKQKLNEPLPAPDKTVERRGRDASGALIIVVATERFISFDDVFFKFDSTELRDRQSAKQLDHMAEALNAPELKPRRFLIEGHTCELGGGDYNLTLSAKRAQVIREHLVKKGVAPERLAVLGCGEAEPAVKIDPKASAREQELQRQRNRRVVLRELPAVPAAKSRKK